MECWKKLELIILLVQLVFYHKMLYKQVKENNYKLIIFLLLQGVTLQFRSFQGGELCWNSDDIFTMEELPKSIVVLGGGYIALEMA